MHNYVKFTLCHIQHCNYVLIHTYLRIFMLFVLDTFLKVEPWSEKIIHIVFLCVLRIYFMGEKCPISDLIGSDGLFSPVLY